MSTISRRDEHGMATAEYAVGTLAAVSVAGVLFKIFTDPKFLELLWQIIEFILKQVFNWGA